MQTQELLEHPLLRPVAAPPAGDPDTALVGLSRAQLRRLLVQARPQLHFTVFFSLSQA